VNLVRRADCFATKNFMWEDLSGGKTEGRGAAPLIFSTTESSGPDQSNWGKVENILAARASIDVWIN
jgi:hypothetical protein